MNKEELIKRATNPKQYDLTDLNFAKIGSADTPFRKMVWEYINGLGFDFDGKSVLDVGCGVGWLLKRVSENNPGSLVGIEPAEQNCKIAQSELPIASITCTDLQSFSILNKFDFVFMILASDYFEDLVPMFEKLKTFLNADGVLVTIDPDYEYNKTERCNYDLQVEHTNENEYLISVTRPSGTMVGFVRKNDYLIDRAVSAGLSCIKTVQISPTKQFLEALPQYKEVKHLNIAQMNLFEIA